MRNKVSIISEIWVNKRNKVSIISEIRFLQ